MNAKETPNENEILDSDFEEIEIIDFENLDDKNDANSSLSFANGFDSSDSDEEDEGLDQYQKKIRERNQEKANKIKKQRARKKEFISDAIFFAVVLAIMIFLNKFIYINARIPSASMEPTISTGDRIFGNRLAYRSGALAERFDIIIFRYPDDPSQLFIKRVIGLPGETVTIIDGRVYINDSDTALIEPDSVLSTVGNWGPYYVPSNGYFVMGDNRTNSLDSRYWDNKFVTEDNVLAKATFRYFPFTKFGKID